jgi:hypothetical protein
MASRQTSLIRRSFSQVDLAFWCMHEHLRPLSVLALPSFLMISALAASVALVVRTWDLPPIYNFLLYGLCYPTVSLWVFTFAPLPCAIFAWHRSQGRLLSPGECLAFLLARSGRLMGVATKLGFYYLLWFLLAGLPLLWFWPRTCLAPMVALFEDDRHIFRRARRLLKEDVAVYVLAIVHFCLLVALAVLIFLPRILVAAELFETPLSAALAKYLWAAEVLGLAVLLSAISVSWSLSLTLLYDHVRQLREGEALRKRIAELRDKYHRQPASAY